MWSQPTLILRVMLVNQFKVWRSLLGPPLEPPLGLDFCHLTSNGSSVT